MNYYDLEPGDQRRRSASRLFRYIRDYIQPYHPYLRKLYREQGVDLSKLRTPDDIRRLPIIDKKNLREDPQLFMLRPQTPEAPLPAGFETAPLPASTRLKYLAQAIVAWPRDVSRLVRPEGLLGLARRQGLHEWLPIHFHVSTGSTGAPTPCAYTYYDLTRILPRIMGVIVQPKQADPDDVAYDWAERTMNIFPGAPHLAFFSPVLAKIAIGASSFETFGGAVIPTERQIVIFAQGGFSSLTAVPSYLVHWLRKAVELQKAGTIGRLESFKRVAVGAEPLSESLREYIRELALSLGAHPRFRVYQTLGMTEMKWAFFECNEGTGIHLEPKHYYWELLDPHTREPVPEGQPGVLTFSHIGWRGTALVRYWTGDLIKGGFRWARCEKCGYTFPRVYPPICRAEKDFTKIKGTRVDLSSLIESVRDTPGVRNFQVAIETEPDGERYARDVLIIYVVPDPAAEPADLEERIRHRVKYYTEVTPDRVLFEENEPEFEKRLFARTGIKAEYILERRAEHI